MTSNSLSVEVREADFGKQMTGTLPRNRSYTVCAARTKACVDGCSQLDWNGVSRRVFNAQAPSVIFFMSKKVFHKICQLSISVKVVE